jgi:hypothetical protein
MSKQLGTSKAKVKGNEAQAGGAESQDLQNRDPRLDAARKRLLESADKADALEAVREIVTNLLGCEEIGLFTTQSGNGALLWSFGIDTEKHATLNSFQEPGLERVLTGELYVKQLRDEGSEDHPPQRAFVPILHHGRTAAVLVMLKLLPQKLGFDETDIDLVKLLSSEAGRALFDGSANADA